VRHQHLGEQWVAGHVQFDDVLAGRGPRGVEGVEPGGDGEIIETNRSPLGACMGRPLAAQVIGER
jgi:hypothetical protein